jgi:hypothetical protein
MRNVTALADCRSAVRIRCAMVFAAAMLLCAAQIGAQDSRFTYQGQLKQNGAPVNDTPNLEFRLFDQLNGGNQIGSVVTRSAVPVADGLFSVEIDFGAAAFQGGQRWLETRVEGQALSPRQAVNAVPLATYALSGAGGTGAPSIQFPGDPLYATVALERANTDLVLIAAGVTGGSLLVAGGMDLESYVLDVEAAISYEAGGVSVGRPVFGPLRMLVRPDAGISLFLDRISRGVVTSNLRIDALRAGGTQPVERICAEGAFVSRVTSIGQAGLYELSVVFGKIARRTYTVPASGPVQVSTWGYDVSLRTNWVPPVATCPN